MQMILSFMRLNYHLLRIQTALQLDFSILQKWLLSNKLLLNKSKSYTMVFGTRCTLKAKTNNLIITCNDGTSLNEVDKVKYLGLWLDSELTFKSHIDYLLHKINFATCVLFRPRNCFTLSVGKKLATQVILPFFDYADVVYQNASKISLLPRNTAYNKLCRFSLGCSYNTHHCVMYNLALTQNKKTHTLAATRI